ncbi:MAG: alpha-ketoglutarate-dependent dioxygenase AlkB [Mucilaginibacter polytrichastri]|nr:alpha-ketoglutarate-dependent dioxygenase AlkB [Mucilaginibacter polytrichastri]
MDLFNAVFTPENLLPQDGEAFYYGPIFPSAEADAFFTLLFSLPGWRQDEVIIFGKAITTKRKVAWFADTPVSYTYSGITRTALPWTKELSQLKQRVEAVCGERFNACLLNLYHSGDEGMGWHSDDEKMIARDSPIASLSLGAKRKFALKHKTLKTRITVELENGSLLLMKGATQRFWLHSLPKSLRVKERRINLTFRRMV